MRIKHRGAIACAVAAAALYALNAPFSKLLLRDVPATMMAAFLYLGAGAGLTVLDLGCCTYTGQTCHNRTDNMPGQDNLLNINTT